MLEASQELSSVFLRTAVLVAHCRSRIWASPWVTATRVSGEMQPHDPPQEITISKNAMANDPTGGFRCARAPDEIDVDGGVFN
jgi:hypothetical protein